MRVIFFKKHDFWQQAIIQTNTKLCIFKGGYCKLLKLLILVSTPLIPINTKSTSIDYQVIDILMRLPWFIYFLNSAVFFLVRKFYMLRCLFGTLYVDMRCFGVSCFFSKHKIPHPNQWGILKPQRNTVYSRKTSE